MTELKNKILDLAMLSISAHNSQPFKLSFENDKISIFINEKRLLPVADKHYKDLLMSLGALLETLEIGLEVLGKRISQFEFFPDFTLTRKIGLLKLDDCLKNISELSLLLNERFSYRGKFEEKIGPPESMIINENCKIEFITADEKIKDVAKTFDQINYKFLVSEGYIEELYSWLRFNRRLKNWSLDGLNSDSMALSPLETFGASIILKPKIFKTLNTLGLASLLVAETHIIQSASSLAVIVSNVNDPIINGKEFMRAWLELTKMRMYGAPLSLLTDDELGLKKVKDIIGANGKTIVNVLRVGPLPLKFKIPERARLTRELLDADI